MSTLSFHFLRCCRGNIRQRWREENVIDKSPVFWLAPVCRPFIFFKKVALSHRSVSTDSSSSRFFNHLSPPPPLLHFSGVYAHTFIVTCTMLARPQTFFFFCFTQTFSCSIFVYTCETKGYLQDMHTQQVHMFKTKKKGGFLFSNTKINQC